MQSDHVARPCSLYHLETGEVKTFPSASAAKKAMREAPGVWSKTQPIVKAASPRPDGGLLQRIAASLLRRKV